MVTDTDRNVTLTQGTDYEITPPSDPIQMQAYIFSLRERELHRQLHEEDRGQKGGSYKRKGWDQRTYTYSGEAQEPGNGDTTQVQVTLDNIPVNSSEYTLGYANNTAAAEASSNAAPTVTVKAIADGNYQGP